MSRRQRVLFLISWCLLATWVLYAGLELAEELEMILKIGHSEHDADLEALLQLASGLKRDVPAVESPSACEAAIRAAPYARQASPHTADWNGTLRFHTWFSIRLHQYLSVYRI